MKLGTTTHPKFCRLMRRLSLSKFSTVGVLESLWMMAAQFTDDGDLTRFDAEDIAAYIDWPDEPQRLIDALVECGWLDQSDHQLMVHDFADHAPHFVSERLRKREQRAAKRAKTTDCPRTVPDSPGTASKSPVLSDLVKSSPAQPSQSKSIQETASSDADAPSKKKSKKKPPHTYSADFERFWFVYWNKVNKATAADAFEDALALIVEDPSIPSATSRDAALDWLVERTKHYARHCPETAEGLHPSTYLNKKRWADELKADRKKTSTTQRGFLEANQC